jgi:hypothetical protein
MSRVTRDAKKDLVSGRDADSNPIPKGASPAPKTADGKVKPSKENPIPFKKEKPAPNPRTDPRNFRK